MKVITYSKSSENEQLVTLTYDTIKWRFLEFAVLSLSTNLQSLKTISLPLMVDIAAP